MAKRGKKSSRKPDEILCLFEERARSAALSRAFREGTMRSSFSYRRDGATGPEWEIDNGDLEDVRSMIVAFRPFVMKSEPVYFNRVANILAQALTDEELIEAEKWHRLRWKMALVGTGKTSDGTRSFDALGTFNVVVNGVMFHNDEDLSNVWLGWDPFWRSMAMNIMTGMLFDCMATLELQVLLIRAAREWGALDLSRVRGGPD